VGWVGPLVTSAVLAGVVLAGAVLVAGLAGEGLAGEGLAGEGLLAVMGLLSCNGIMQFNTYITAGALIAAGLVNATAADLPGLSAVLREHDVHLPDVTGATAPAIRAWTGRLRPVFEAAPAAKAALADGLLVTARCRPRLVSHHGLAPHLHYAALDAGLPARVRALTASGLAHLIADGAGHRLGCCLRDDCGVVFVDVSRGGGRRFCSVRCANAVNVRRHRARTETARDYAGAVA
jgi:predicted RNA-binding Zn ribbon-like protein